MCVYECVSVCVCVYVCACVFSLQKRFMFIIFIFLYSYFLMYFNIFIYFYKQVKGLSIVTQQGKIIISLLAPIQTHAQTYTSK